MSQGESKKAEFRTTDPAFMTGHSKIMRIALLPAFNFCEFNLHAIFFIANIT